MPDLNASIRDIPIPQRMRSLPISDQGFPLPWFVARTYDGEPVPQAADPVKRLRAARLGLCWCCGQPVGVYKAFVIGPMCMVNHVTSEPACHFECAEYAVKACPYLSHPNMQRNPTEIGKVPPPGVMIERNPGVALIWTTRHFSSFRARDGGILFALGDPVHLLFFYEGRRATRDEIMESIKTGVPRLQAEAAKEGLKAETELALRLADALLRVPED